MKKAYNTTYVMLNSLAAACKRVSKLFVKNKKAAEHCSIEQRKSAMVGSGKSKFIVIEVNPRSCQVRVLKENRLSWFVNRRILYRKSIF